MRITADPKLNLTFRGSKTLRVLFVAGLLAAAIATAPMPAGASDTPGAYAIGLWGDLPYSDVQAQVGVPNLIAYMNRHELAFTVHDGDLKAGSGTPGPSMWRMVTTSVLGDGAGVSPLML